jgi:predicted RNA-binding protein with PIN domain
MPYIIDGHNLIPHIPNLKLSDPDDEMKLIQILSEFASQKRSKIEVYFDRAPAGGARSEPHGLVIAHFVRRDSTADKAIKRRISQLGQEVKNWTVISSDREILAEARGYRSKVMSAADFAAALTAKAPMSRDPEDKNSDPEVSPGEVDYWLDKFS